MIMELEIDKICLTSLPYTLLAAIMHHHSNSHQYDKMDKHLNLIYMLEILADNYISVKLSDNG